MERADILQGLSKFLNKYTSQTNIGTFREQTRSSLISDGLGTRANSIWKMAEYIVAFKDDGDGTPKTKYLDGWAELVRNYKDQFLILQVDDHNWEMYDAYGTFMGGNDFILSHLAQKSDLAEKSENRKCIFGPVACGVGKPGMPAFLEGVISCTLDYEKNLESLSPHFKITENRLYVGECCIGILPEQAEILMSKPNHDKDANINISWEYDGRTFCLYRELRSEQFEVFISTYNAAYAGVFEIVSQTNDSGTNTYTLYRINDAIQKIYFGAPGSGKSHSVNIFVKQHKGIEFRTTFHPDSDYSSFVGTYKPRMSSGTIEYTFVPQVFTDAYVASWKNPTTPVYLIIEEINRGNCAQVFGDLFQLLDRKNGWSEYAITVDADWKDYLTKALTKIEGNEVDGSAGIEGGRIKLRPNFNILATMNTSDQSLFPMDSAFKRRWSWEFVPIDSSNKESQFKISIGTKTYKWASFLDKANERIHKLSDSEDKQMGNFFIKRDIGVEEFKSKVLFYLWSEVCKEYEHAGSFFKNKRNNDAEFTFNNL